MKGFLIRMSLLGEKVSKIIDFIAGSKSLEKISCSQSSPAAVSLD